MGSKVKCPSCGAKNDALNRRCRVCTTIINMDLPEAGKEPVEALPDIAADNSFDANVINQQMQPTKARFSSGGGLSARLAAANGGAPPASFGSTAPLPSPAPAAMGPDTYGPSMDAPMGPAVPDHGDTSGPSGITFDAPAAPPPLAEPAPMAPLESFDSSAISFDAPAPQAHAPSPPPPLLPDQEKFDPDALFRDMG